MDGHCGIILATIATAADYDDSTLLIPLLDKHLQYLNEHANRVVGDSSYGTIDNMAQLRQRKCQPYLKPRPSRSDNRHWLDRMPEGCDRNTAKRLMKRRLHISEGRFAEAHERYDHRNCRWRRRWRVQIQCYLVALVQNITRLARHAKPLRQLGVMQQLQSLAGLISRAIFAAIKPFSLPCQQSPRYLPQM